MNSIISKELFNEIMSDVEKAYKYQEGLNNYLIKNGAEGYIYQPDCIDSVIKLLHKIFGEHDKNEWICYFCFELDFGKKYKDGDIKDENGKNIQLTSYDDLYEILTN